MDRKLATALYNAICLVLALSTAGLCLYLRSSYRIDPTALSELRGVLATTDDIEHVRSIASQLNELSQEQVKLIDEGVRNVATILFVLAFAFGLNAYANWRDRPSNTLESDAD